MKTIIILFYIFLPGLIFSQDYFPLNVGNRWDYNEERCDNPPYCSDSIYKSIEIQRDTIVNGRRYFFPVEFADKWFYCRVDSNKLLALDDQNKELALFDFNAQIGDTNYINKDYGWYSVLGQKDTSEVFGINTEILIFEYRDWVNQEDVWFAKKFGTVFKYITYDFGYSGLSLMGCKINNETYGVLTKVNNNLKNNPRDYKLYQNYPNPFNPITTILFSIPENQVMQLTIYDILGNEIVKLVNEYKPAGTYSIEFNGDNLSGGIYFYRLTSGNFIQTKKFVLLK